MKSVWCRTSAPILLCSAVLMNAARAEDVSLEEIESVWQATAIKQVGCKVTFLTWTENAINPFDNQSLPASWQESDGQFFRDASLGMKLECGNHKCNLLKNVASSTYLDSKQGYHNFRYDELEQAEIRSYLVISILLHWLDPKSLELVDFQSAPNATFKVESDSKHGEVIRIRSKDKRKGVDKEFVLSKSYDWRIVESWSKENDTMIDRKEYEYARTKSLLELRSARNWVFGPNGKLRSKNIFKFNSVSPQCSIDDLTLDLPPRCVVTNFDGSMFLVNSDGSMRRILVEEKKIIKSYNELFDTPEGALLKPPGNR